MEYSEKKKLIKLWSEREIVERKLRSITRSIEELIVFGDKGSNVVDKEQDKKDMKEAYEANILD